jgi:hypothetical protein
MAVCSSAHDSVRQSGIVCGSASSSVWQCKRQCAAVQSEWQCVIMHGAVCDSARQCGSVCTAVRQCC